MRTRAVRAAAAILAALGGGGAGCRRSPAPAITDAAAPIEISGQVRFDDGAPAVGALIWGLGSGASSYCEAWTGSEGRYRLACPGADSVDVTFHSPARAASLQEAREKGDVFMMANPVPRGKPPPRGAYTTSGSPYRGVDRVIPRGKTISGRVLDPDGFPVHGARVGEIGARDSVRGVPGMADAVSDGQGRFEISGLVGDGERKLWVATDE